MALRLLWEPCAARILAVVPLKLRTLLEPPLPPAFNMAADRFLLDTIDDDNQVVLRLYGWNHPTISLGRLQKADEVLDLEATKRDGIAWVSRPTGGRALLHWNDLTYSVVFSVNNASLGRTVAETYRIISACLIAGLQGAGITAAPHDTPYDTALARTESKLPCFLAPNRDEIMVGGRKLIGSAQKRTAGGVLQHGSIPFTTDCFRLPDYSKIPGERRTAEKRLFAMKCSCIAQLTPALTTESLARHLVDGFARTLGAEPYHSEWSSAEDGRILQLSREGGVQ